MGDIDTRNRLNNFVKFYWMLVNDLEEEEGEEGIDGGIKSIGKEQKRCQRESWWIFEEFDFFWEGFWNFIAEK